MMNADLTRKSVVIVKLNGERQLATLQLAYYEESGGLESFNTKRKEKML